MIQKHFMTSTVARLICLGMVAMTLSATAAEYFAGKQGDDTHASTRWNTAFLTAQKGADALAPVVTLVAATTPVSEIPRAQSQGGGPVVLRVLFIGNSAMAQYNLPRMIASMAKSAPADQPRIEVGDAIVGGQGLKGHWNAGTGEGSPRAMIAKGKWDYVVIQDIYAHKGNRPDSQIFEAYATRFDHAITRAGSKTIVFATATVTEFYISSYHYPDEFKALNDMQIAFAKKNRRPVAAAGYAWMNYLGPEPTLEHRLDLYDQDKGHPGPKGTYIYACLLYAVLTGINPEGLSCEFPEIRGGISIPKDESIKMQQVAWEQYRENNVPSRPSEDPEASAERLQSLEILAKFKENQAVPGWFTADMEAYEKRINASEQSVRETIIEGVADLVPELTADAWRLLVETAQGTDAGDSQTALRALMAQVPPDKVKELLDQTEEDTKNQVLRAKIEPTLVQMRDLTGKKQWKKLIDEFKDTDLSGWPDDMAREATLLRGMGQLNLKNGKEAEAELRGVIDRTPTDTRNAFVWWNLAENYQQNLKDEKKALEAYIKVSEMTKGSLGWITSDAALKTIRILRGQSRNEEALKILEALNRDVENGSWRIQKFSAYTETLIALGRKADALAECKRMLKLEGMTVGEKDAVEKKLKELEGDVGQTLKE